MNLIDIMAKANERAWELVETWNGLGEKAMTAAEAAELLTRALTVNTCDQHPDAPVIGNRCGLCPVVPDVCAHCRKEITGRWIGPLTGPGLGGPKYHQEIPECRSAGEDHSQRTWDAIVAERKGNQ